LEQSAGCGTWRPSVVENAFTRVDVAAGVRLAGDTLFAVVAPAFHDVKAAAKEGVSQISAGHPDEN
jgi:hypothetical protein